MTRRVLCVLAALLCAASAHADGIARGKLALVDWRDRAYGFSAYSQLWTSTPITGRVLQRKAGDYLAAIVAGDRVYAYKPVNDRWVATTYTGTWKGLEVSGSTAVGWSSTACYAIASIWTLWRAQPLAAGEVVRGGGSAGSFAVVWTTQQAYAYNASNGQWIAQPLAETSQGGIACNGMGLVWTSHRAYAFSPAANAWIELAEIDPIGFSAGSGNVCLVWSQETATAYSQPLQQWVTVAASEGPLAGGDAGGDVALVWNWSCAYAFNANTAQWSTLYRDAPGTAPPEPDEADFRVTPDPCVGSSLTLRLPAGEAWRLEVFDLAGRCLRRIENAAGAIEWDRRGDDGVPLASGTYWVRAASAAGRVEARRIVLLP
jgi:hypothetical protein